MAMTSQEKLQQMLIDPQWVKEMFGSCAKARETLLDNCGGPKAPQLLLNLDDKEIAHFQQRMVAFSSSARGWVRGCADHMLPIFEKAFGKAIPPFTICGLGSFGREEMSPYSDCDIVILCSPEDVADVGSGFAEKFATATSLMSSIPSAQCFSITFELSAKVMSPGDLAESIGQSNTAIPDVFTIYDHVHSTHNKFVDQFVEAVKPSLVPLKSRVNKGGLDALFTGTAYTNYLTARSSYNIKTLVAFFQRAMAVVSAVRGHSHPDQHIQSETSTRIEKYADHATKVFYFQVLAVRYEMHFKVNKEEDFIFFSDQAVKEELSKVKALQDQGLNKIFAMIDDMLKSLG